MPTTKLNTEFQVKTAADLLCCAFEGGSNYWYNITDYQKPDRLEFLCDTGTAKILEREPEVCPHLDYPLNEGGAVHIVDMEDNDRPYVLNLEACQRGWQVMHDSYPRHWADAVSDDGAMDSTTGDVYLQCCLFGEVIYG